MWEENEALNFGNASGEVYAFYSDADVAISYSDNGNPIEAYWDLPDVDGNNFYKNKTFTHISIRLAAAAVTGVIISVQRKGAWYVIYDSKGKARFFSWSNLTWSKFSWSGDPTPRTLNSRIKVKRVDKASYRFKNNVLNEPFGIFNLALEYTVDGNYKG